MPNKDALSQNNLEYRRTPILKCSELLPNNNRKHPRESFAACGRKQCQTEEN
jgi:hypothetical protein